MNGEKQTENVKERLNTMIHKKLFEQQENREQNVKEQAKGHGEGTTSQALKEDFSTAATVTNPEGNCPPGGTETILDHLLLNDILNEKKKALLQNKEVVDFLHSKLK